MKKLVFLEHKQPLDLEGWEVVARKNVKSIQHKSKDGRIYTYCFDAEYQRTIEKWHYLVRVIAGIALVVFSAFLGLFFESVRHLFVRKFIRHYFVKVDPDENLSKVLSALSATYSVQPLSDGQLDHTLQTIVYGQAVGDAIGLFTEFTTRNHANEILGKTPIEFALRERYIKAHNDKEGHVGHIEKFPINGPTDDTDQLICLLRAYYHFKVKGDQPFSIYVAQEITRWRNNGIGPVGTFKGRPQARCAGLGYTVSLVLGHRLFLKNPARAAREIWETDKKPFKERLAPNGALMRTAALAPIFYRDLPLLVQRTQEAAQVTHADPRAIASCVALNIAIALIMRGSKDCNQVMNDAEKAAVAVLHQEMAAYPGLASEKELKSCIDELHAHMFCQQLDTLDLDEGWKDSGKPNRIGYTFKCLGAAFWALQRACDLSQKKKPPDQIFRILIEAIAREGGDADTNAAPAGALIGAFLSLTYPLTVEKIPPSWFKGLADHPILDQCVEWIKTWEKQPT